MSPENLTWVSDDRARDLILLLCREWEKLALRLIDADKSNASALIEDARADIDLRMKNLADQIALLDNPPCENEIQVKHTVAEIFNERLGLLGEFLKSSPSTRLNLSQLSF